MEIIISGALGHMGQAVTRYCRERSIDIAFGVDAMAGKGGVMDYPVYPSFEAAPAADTGIIIDFSRPEGLPGLLTYARQHRRPLVLCTTGIQEKEQQNVIKASAEIPILQSANMSLGVCVLKKLIRQAAQSLGEDYDVEIIETHHNRKLDAPSGTALALFNAVKNAYPEEREPVYGREGRSEKRQHRDIGIHAVRGGTVAGIHTVDFFGPDETLTLTHTAQSRDVFAAGAVRAARFLEGKAPGMYTLEDTI